MGLYLRGHKVELYGMYDLFSFQLINCILSVMPCLKKVINLSLNLFLCTEVVEWSVRVHSAVGHFALHSHTLIRTIPNISKLRQLCYMARLVS
jgi:hypothetical protein